MIIEKDHGNEIKDTLIKIDKILKTKSISTIVLQNYFGREYGGFQNIEKKKLKIVSKELFTKVLILKLVYSKINLSFVNGSILDLNLIKISFYWKKIFQITFKT